MILTLPWPPSKLSPNARPLRMEKARLTKKYRRDCYFAARAGGAWPLDDDTVTMTVTFCPPIKRHRDIDNLVASVKGAFDGLSDAISIDDRHFVPTYRMGDVVPGGAVVVEIQT